MIKLSSIYRKIDEEAKVFEPLYDGYSKNDHGVEFVYLGATNIRLIKFGALLFTRRYEVEIKGYKIEMSNREAKRLFNYAKKICIEKRQKIKYKEIYEYLK